MLALPKPEVILTHESDLDGLLSGLLLRRLAHKLFDQEVRLEAHHYTSWKQRQLRERMAWVSDFAFEPRMDRPDWLVLDHHATDTPAKEARLIHDLGKSASLLCYELCREHDLAKPELDRLVHLSNVVDLYLVEDPDFELACDYGNLVKTYGFWNLHALIEGNPDNLLNHPLLEVMAVKRRVEDPLGFAWSQKNVVDISPTVGFVDTVVGNANSVVHRLLREKATPYAVLVTLFAKSNRTVIASFRSENGEALKVAQQLQGGGHANASGATLPRSVQTVEDGVLWLRQVLSPQAKRGVGLNSLEQAFAALEVKPKAGD
ncbi:MAG: DHH family phosphoesterase [Verrucomicrobia bacterium]|nr:DHH family phosphoesterase [Verrucomicrobiota bacterium]